MALCGYGTRGPPSALNVSLCAPMVRRKRSTPSFPCQTRMDNCSLEIRRLLCTTMMAAWHTPRHRTANAYPHICRYITNLTGQVLRSFSSGKEEGGDFVACTLSLRAEWIYCAGEDGVLYCFSCRSGKLEHVVTLHDKDIVTLTHHPNRNILGSASSDSHLRLWAP